MPDDIEGASGAISLTRFTCQGSEQDFKRAFDSYADHIRAHPGFRQFQALSAVLSPGVYLNVGWWQDPGAVQDSGAGPGRREVEKAFRGVAAMDTRITTKVANGLAIKLADPAPGEEPAGYSDERLVVVTTYVPQDESFGTRFIEHTRLLRAQPGFVFHEGVREQAPSPVHHNIEWWLNSDAYSTALLDPAVRESAARLAGLADVSTLRGRNFANGEPLAG